MCVKQLIKDINYSLFHKHYDSLKLTKNKNDTLMILFIVIINVVFS
jgi:hypothetical protein